jgi:hypothetical protein
MLAAHAEPAASAAASAVDREDSLAADALPPQAPSCAAAADVVEDDSTAAAASGYVCVLDDDILLHPLGLMQLVDELEANPTLFMATGTQVHCGGNSLGLFAGIYLCWMVTFCCTSLGLMQLVDEVDAGLALIFHGHRCGRTLALRTCVCACTVSGVDGCTCLGCVVEVGTQADATVRCGVNGFVCQVHMLVNYSAGRVFSRMRGWGRLASAFGWLQV